MAKIKETKSPNFSGYLYESDATSTKDSFFIEAKDDGATSATVYTNILFGFYDSTGTDPDDGNDKFVMRATNKTASYDAIIQDNLIESTGGKDTLELTAKSNGRDAYARSNTLISGGDEGIRVKLTAQTKESTAGIEDNSISSGDGNNRFDLTARTSSKGDADIIANVDNNTIEAGDGNDTVRVKAQTAKAITPYGNIVGAATVNGNEFSLGDGNDKIDIQVKSGALSEVSGNNFDTSNNFDVTSFTDQIKINVSSTGGAQKIGDEVISTGEVYITNNSISSNYDNSTLKTSIKARATTIEIYGNSIEARGDDGSLSLNARAKGGIDQLAGDVTQLRGDLFFFDNELSAEFDIKLNARNSVVANDNNIESFTGVKGFSARADSLEITNNEIISASENKISLRATTKDTGSYSLIEGNTLGGGDKSLVEITSKGNVNIVDNQFYGGSANGSDELLLKIKVGGGDLHSNVVKGENYSTSQIALDIDTGLGANEIDTFLTNNYLDFSNYGGDTLTLKNRNQDIDLTDGFANNGAGSGGLDKLILGSKTTIKLDEFDVLGLTDDYDRTLFIGGKSNSTVDITGSNFSVNGTQDGYDGTDTLHLSYNNGGDIINLHIQSNIDVIGLVI